MPKFSVAAIMMSGNVYETNYVAVDLEVLQWDFEERLEASGEVFAFGKMLLLTRHIESFRFKYIL